MGNKQTWIYKWLILIAFGVTLNTILNNLGTVLGYTYKFVQIFYPFIYGIAIAYIIDIIMRLLSNIKLFSNHRALQILASYIIFLQVIILVLCAVIPQQIQSIQSLIDSKDYYIEQVYQWIEAINNKLGTQIDIGGILNLENSATNEKLGQLLLKYSETLVNTGTQLIQTVIQILTAFAASIYIVLDKYKLKRATLKLMHSMLNENVVEYLCKIVRIFDKQTTNFLVGKVFDQLIIGVLTFICMAIMGLPYSVLIQTIVGITNIIPVFGPFIGAIPGVLILLIENPIQAVWFGILIIIIQQLDGNFIGPKILGQTSNIQAFWILFQIVVGGNLAGVVGMILGVPIFVVVQTLLSEYQSKVLKNKGLQDKFGDTSTVNTIKNNNPDINKTT